MSKTKPMEPLFPDDWNGQTGLLKLTYKFGNTKTVLAELKRRPRTGYWANSPEAVGDWADKKWVEVERHERLHLLYEDGSGNAYFISEKNGEIWEFIHDYSPKGSQYGYFGPATGLAAYSNAEPYQRFIEWLREYNDETYKSPFRKSDAQVRKDSAPNGPTMQQRLAGARKGLLGGAVVGTVVGAGMGAFGGAAGAAAGAVVGGVGLGAIHGAKGFINPEDTMHQEFADDPEVFFSLEERGGSHGSKGGRTDTGAGDRAVAEKTRISGLDQLRPMLTHIPDALRAGGWDDGKQLSAAVGPDTHDEAPGRDWSLKGAIAEARITAPASKPDAEAAEAALHDSNTPEDAVFFEEEPGHVVAVIRYISDGFAANASSELVVELRAAGYTVTEV